MNNILAACLLSSLIACTLDDPYMPVNPEEKPAPPVVTEYQPVALTIGANGRFDVSGSSVKNRVKREEFYLWCLSTTDCAGTFYCGGNS